MSDNKKKKQDDLKFYLVDVVFKTPVMGQGLIKAENEDDAIEKLKEVYQEAEDLHIVSLKETSEEEVAEMIADTIETDLLDDEGSAAPTVH